jgi:hypothetical protein
MKTAIVTLAFTPATPGWEIEDTLMRDGFPPEAFSLWRTFLDLPLLHFGIPLMLLIAAISIAAAIRRYREGSLHRRTGLPTVLGFLPVTIAIGVILLLQETVLEQLLATAVHSERRPYAPGSAPAWLAQQVTVTRLLLTTGLLVSASTILAIRWLARGANRPRDRANEGSSPKAQSAPAPLGEEINRVCAWFGISACLGLILWSGIEFARDMRDGIVRPWVWCTIHPLLTRPTLHARLGSPTPKHSMEPYEEVWMIRGRSGAYRYLKVWYSALAWETDDKIYALEERFSRSEEDWSHGGRRLEAPFPHHRGQDGLTQTLE